MKAAGELLDLALQAKTRTAAGVHVGLLEVGTA